MARRLALNQDMLVLSRREVLPELVV